MAYCLQADIETTVGVGLNTEPESAPTYDVYLDLGATQVTRCIASADAEIDMYLAAVATVPFTTVPAAVKEVSILLAAARALEQGRLDYVVQDGPDPESLGKIPRSNALRAEGQRKLQLIKENATALLGASAGSGASAGIPVYNDPPERFTEDEMDTWV